NPEQISTTAVDETALESGSDNDGPNGTTADFSSPSNEGKADDQELGLGKRTRRPKYFPDHVSPEDTLRVYKPAKNSGGGVKRGGTTGLTPTTSIKMPRLVPEGLIDPVSTDPVSIDPVLIDPVDIKKEKVNETEEETGEVEEPVIPGSSKELTEVSPVCPQKRGRGRPRKIKTLDLESFESATESSIEEPADNIEYPIQGNAQMKITDYDDSEDYCKICFDGGQEIIVCCDTCPNVFHVNCHVPLIKVIPGEDEPFYCFNCTSKQMIDERLAALPPVEGSEDQVLEESNEHHFALACKFTMECHLIPEIPTVRWIFPRLYHVVVGKDKVPFHLKYIRERLTLGQPAPFPNLRTFVLSFRQMFIQAFIYYQNYEHAKEHLPVIHTCFQKFLALLEEYYPSFRKDFDDVVISAGSFNKKK
ncbi:E3 ubiquitin-protein ligase TRIM33, partial [Orchesella cincta]